MSDEDIDDEAQSDLELRRQTERDPNRTRGLPNWTPPTPIGDVACRGRCGARVEWTEESEQYAAMWDRELARRGEPALERDRLLFCDACRLRGRTFSAEAATKSAELLAKHLRELRECNDPEREREAARKLTALGYQDVDGTIAAIRQKRANAESRQKRVTAQDVLR